MFSWYPRRIKRAAAIPTGLVTFRAATRVVKRESMVVVLQRNNKNEYFCDCRSLAATAAANKIILFYERTGRTPYVTDEQ
jgi:hypothetical protein